jgi:vacuolar-type H+-ATPase subunit H
MENENTLDHLLQIEAKAAALVSDAQAEADRRIHESEEKNRAAYEERFREEAQKLEASLKNEKEKIKSEYQKALDEYRTEISGISINVDNFCALLNGYLTNKG